MGITWWVTDLPPVSGELRAIFYAGLLVLCIIDSPSPLHAALIIGRTERAFYTPVGIMRTLGIRWVSPTTLWFVTALTVIVWLAATVGLLQPFTAILTFLGFAFLHGINAGALGSNHSTHAALYGLFCMSFSVSNDACSLDHYLSSHGHWALLLRAGSVLESGFPRKLMLVLLAYCMFAAGVAKLRSGGLRWLNGAALRFYIAESADYARWPDLARVLVKSPALCCYLSWFTVIVELSAILVLWNPSLCLPLVLAWICLHVGILLVMMPAYWVQMWCYILVLDWRHLIAVAANREPIEVVNSSANASSVGGELGATVLCIIGSLISLGLVLVLVRQLESWPLTSVPMYSNAVSPDAEQRPSREELQLRAQKATGGDSTAWKRAWVPSEVWEDIWIVPVGSEPPIPLFDLLDKQPDTKFVRWSQFAKVVRGMAIADLVAKPRDRVDFDATDAEYPATRFLRELVTVVKHGLPDWRRYQRLDFVCRADVGWIVIGRADL
jgi:hypothetical protein